MNTGTINSTTRPSQKADENKPDTAGGRAEQIGKGTEGDVDSGARHGHGAGLDSMGETGKKKQRLDVEFGTFHEFTAVNKTAG